MSDEALRSLEEANRRRADPEAERELRELRLRLFAERRLEPSFGLGVASRAELDAVRLREALATHGALHVRGLIGAQPIALLCGAIDSALEAQGKALAGARPDETRPWFELLDNIQGGESARHLVYKTGAVLAADSPRGLQLLIDVLREAGIDRLASEYFGERPALSAEKTTLRRVEPGEEGGWHQDGSFLGANIRALNVWIALSDCGSDAPGLELVPTRLKRILATNTEGAPLDFCVAQSVVDREFPGKTIRPSYKAGDAMLFDHFLLHRTWRTHAMPRPRYAVENWFFAPSAYPDGQTGLYI